MRIYSGLQAEAGWLLGCRALYCVVCAWMEAGFWEGIYASVAAALWAVGWAVLEVGFAAT